LLESAALPDYRLPIADSRFPDYRFPDYRFPDYRFPDYRLPDYRFPMVPLDYSYPGF